MWQPGACVCFSPSEYPSPPALPAPTLTPGPSRLPRACSRMWSTGAESCAGCTAGRSSCARLLRGISGTSHACARCWKSAKVGAVGACWRAGALGCQCAGSACLLVPCPNCLPCPRRCHACTADRPPAVALDAVQRLIGARLLIASSAPPDCAPLHLWLQRRWMRCSA